MKWLYGEIKLMEVGFFKLYWCLYEGYELLGFFYFFYLDLGEDKFFYRFFF